jgi:hypothetical protein
LFSLVSGAVGSDHIDKNPSFFALASLDIDIFL